MPAAETTRPSRHAAGERGQRACTRLLIEAERRFAEKGYAKASTREICAAAGLNVAAIHDHIGLTRPDDDVHRLCFALVAMAHDYCMSREFMNIPAPGLLARPDALALQLEGLVDWGLALVQHERTRRLQPEPMPDPVPTP